MFANWIVRHSDGTHINPGICGHISISLLFKTSYQPSALLRTLPTTRAAQRSKSEPFPALTSSNPVTSQSFPYRHCLIEGLDHCTIYLVPDQVLHMTALPTNSPSFHNAFLTLEATSFKPALAKPSPSSSNIKSTVACICFNAPAGLNSPDQPTRLRLRVFEAAHMETQEKLCRSS